MTSLMAHDARHAPSFLVISPSRGAHRLAARLATHAPAELASSPAEARPLLREPRRWLGWWVDGPFDEHVLRQLVAWRPPGSPPPILVTNDTRPDVDTRSLPHRWLPRSAPRAEERYFLGYCLANEVSGRPLVAAAVENLGREHELTVRQMELAAIATLAYGRDDILRGLGVTANTLKTRVRQLLRILQHETLDSLGKTVLRRALDLVPTPDPAHGLPQRTLPPPVPGLLPAERMSASPSPDPSPAPLSVRQRDLAIKAQVSSGSMV